MKNYTKKELNFLKWLLFDDKFGIFPQSKKQENLSSLVAELYNLSILLDNFPYDEWEALGKKCDASRGCTGGGKL